MTKPTRKGSMEFANTLRSLEPSLTPAPLHEPSPDAVAVPRDRYTLGRELAQGTSCTVYEAFDEVLRRTVALKVLYPALASDPERRRRFLEDAKATGELEHAGIVPVHDVGQLVDGRTFVAMRLLRGKSLTRMIDEQRGAGGQARSLATFLRAVLRACETVAFAHARGVIHRDLQPDNVFIGAFGEVFVLHWGLFKWNPMPHLVEEGVGPSAGRDPAARRRAPGRKAASGAPERESAGLLRLSAALPFMTPEQVSGDGLDTLSDVYGLGTVLYTAACGLPPVESIPGEALAELVDRVRGATRVLPSERRPPSRSPRALPWRVPPAIDAICERALSVRRSLRYPTVTAMIDDLAAYLDRNTAREA